MVDDSGFVVSPGFETFVSVTTYKVKGSVTQFNWNFKLNFTGHSKRDTQLSKVFTDVLFFSLQITKKKELPAPYENSSCYEEKKSLKYFDSTYSLAACYYECFAEYQIHVCGCKKYQLTGMPSFLEFIWKIQKKVSN